MNKKLYVIILLFLIFINLGSSKAATFYENDLNSDVVYVVNKSSGTAVIEKNINKKRSPASITKIMTFIIAYEKSKDIDKTKVKATKDVLDLVDPESSGCELKDGEVREYEIHPEDFGIDMASNRSIKVQTPEESQAMLLGVLDGQKGAARNIVLMNAGAALYAANVASDMAEGINKAREAIDSGAARPNLEQFIQFNCRVV